jgi:4-amino-4-deoxy-L-arabinose transferase-like glycosyltransferase
MPSPALLWWSRLPMAILAIASGVLLFFLTTKAAGRAAGYILLILFVLNTYFFDLLRRAMAESPLLVFVLLTAFCAYQALRSWQRVDPKTPNRQNRFTLSVIWFGLMGVFCGLAAGTKLNGAAVMLAGLGLCVLLPYAHRKIPQAKWSATLCACVLLLGTGLTFIALNPFLYRNPVKRTQMMVQQRLEEMSTQLQIFPELAIDVSRRIPLIHQRIFEDYSTFHLVGGEIINPILSVIGLGYLLYSSWRWLQKPITSGAGIVILLVAFTTATPALFTPIDYDRYYLLPVVFSTVFIAVAIGWIIRLVLRLALPRAAGVCP